MTYSNDEELIECGNMTYRQRAVLEIMLKHDEELIYEKGAGWWIGDERTNGKLANSLLYHCCISTDDYSSSGIQRYRINGTGKKSLETGKLYELKIPVNE